MPLDSYANLLAEVDRWLGGSSDPNFASAIETAVVLAEADMNSGFISPDGSVCAGLRVPETMKRVSVTVDEKYEVLPTDFLAARAVYTVSDSNREYPLGAITEERAGWLDRVTPHSGPKYYCITGRQIRLTPKGDDAVKMRMVYYATVDPLANAGACTAVLAAYPQVYLYGTLAHMEGWVVNDPRIQQWKSLFMNAIIGANKASARRASTYAA